jgi:hypothetical protein
MLTSTHHVDVPDLTRQVTNPEISMAFAARDSQVVHFASKLQEALFMGCCHAAQAITVCKHHLTKDGRIWDQEQVHLQVKSGPCLGLKDASKELLCLIQVELMLWTKIKQPDFNESHVVGNSDMDCNIWQKLIDLYKTIDRHARLSQDQLQGSEKLTYEVFQIANDFQKRLCDLLDFTNNHFDCDFLEFNGSVAWRESELQSFSAAAFVVVTSTENALSSIPARMAGVIYSSNKNDYSSFKARSILSLSFLVDGTADLVQRKKLKQSTKPVSFNEFGTSTAPPPHVLEIVITFIQSFGSSAVPLPSCRRVPHLSGSTCDDGQQLKQLRRAEIDATELQWHVYHDKLSAHEPVPLDPAQTQQPNADENCPPTCLQHAPLSMPMPPAPLGIAALVPNVAFHCKDNTSVTPSSQSGAPAGSITMIEPGDVPQKGGQFWNPTGPAKGRVSALDVFESGHYKETHPGCAIPTRKSLFITCIFASARVFFLAAAAILLGLVCQPQFDVGSSPSLSMKYLFGTKRRCENDQTTSIGNVAPVAMIAFLILSIVTVFPCDHINWRYFPKQAAHLVCCVRNSHCLSPQFCTPSLKPCRTTDRAFFISSSPQQTVHSYIISKDSWCHGSLVSTLKIMTILSQQCSWRKVVCCILRISLEPNCYVFSRIPACFRSALRAACQLGRSCRISHLILRVPCALSHPGDLELRALNGVFAQLFTELLSSFLQLAFVLNIGRASSVLRAIASVSVLCIKRMNRKWPCTRRAATTVMMTLCFSIAPLCEGQGDRSCALSSDGAASCWGRNDVGQVMLVVLYF